MAVELASVGYFGEVNTALRAATSVFCHLKEFSLNFPLTHMLS